MTSKAFGLAQLGNAYADGALSNRNKIINGAMVVDQRNAGAAVTPTNGQFSVDRFKFFVSQASKFTAQQNAGSVTPPVGFRYYLGVTSSSAYSIASGDFFFLRHPLEGHNVADFGWGSAGAKTVTLSFWVRSSLTGTFGGSLTNQAENRSYAFTYTISSANTWEQKSVTIEGDTSGTWVTDNSAGIYLNFGIGVGSTFSGAAGAWAAAQYISATGATSVVGTSGATFYITGVQLEAGDTATPFEHRSYSDELQRCMRFFEKIVATAQVWSHPDSSSNHRLALMFKERKRTTPTITSSGWSINTPTEQLGDLDFAAFYTTAGFFRTINGTIISADAEL